MITTIQINSKFNKTNERMQQQNLNTSNHPQQTFDIVFTAQSPISLENDDFNIQHPNRIPMDLQKDDFQLHFDEIFCGNNPPNTSRVSNSTISNRNFDYYFDISEQFFSDNIGSNQRNQEPLEYDFQGLSDIKNESIREAPKEQEKSNSNVAVKLNSMDIQAQKHQNCHDQTKNIPKNYIKAIFSFILENTDYLERLFNRADLTENNNSMVRFLDYVKIQKKTKKYTIQRLKTLWLDPQNGKAMRIISFQFLRKRSLSYIFGSKIAKKVHHLKHRSKFIRSVGNPWEFTNIK